MLLVGGVVAYRLVGTGFLPEMDEGAFVLDYFTPGGTALAETDRKCTSSSGFWRGRRRSRPRRVDWGGARALRDAAEQRRSRRAAGAVEPAQPQSVDEVIDDVRAQINGRCRASTSSSSQILSDVSTICGGARIRSRSRLFGEQLEQLETYATTLAPPMRKIERIEDLYDGVGEPAAEM